jgi:hypothetical protein
MRILPIILISLLLTACGAGGPGTPAAASEGLSKTSGSLTVTVFEPEDGAVVNTDRVKVKGEAPPETVVTINDDILIVEDGGMFESEVGLDEGPNVIEIVASDLDGNEVDFMITVTYEP